jgi:hypothetical protein
MLVDADVSLRAAVCDVTAENQITPSEDTTYSLESILDALKGANGQSVLASAVTHALA